MEHDRLLGHCLTKLTMINKRRAVYGLPILPVRMFHERNEILYEMMESLEINALIYRFLPHPILEC
jgi:hypothetical protein